MALSKFQTQNTFKRWVEREDIRNNNLNLIQQQRFFDIDSPQRIQKFLTRRGLSEESDELFESPAALSARSKASLGLKQYLNLERILGANDLVNVYFLQDALLISKTVGRIWICDSAGVLRGYANGFMVSPTLMLTNYHVLQDAETAGYSKIEFNYQLDDQDRLTAPELFQLDPDTFYYSFENLDFAIVAVKQQSSSGAVLSQFGYNHLSMDEGKAIISQWLNIIQHPAGMPKQVGLRGNQLIDILDDFIHYQTDTAPGSSGSPVYNERWEVVALHHSGVWEEDDSGNILALNGDKWNSSMGEDQIKWKANEGVRISSILKHLKVQSFKPEQASLLDEVLNPPAKLVDRNPATFPAPFTATVGSGNVLTRLDANGILTCNFPVSVSFMLNASNNLKPAADTTVHVSVGSHSAVSNSGIGVPDVLAQARLEFSKWKDIIAVRMGYVFKNGWITNERAIVVTVKKRKSIYELEKDGDLPLPDYFMNYPVEVSGPTVEELIAFHFGQGKLESLLSPLPISPNELKYIVPTDLQLNTITKKMNVIAHVSPEEGWKNLKQFLSNTQKTLTIAMYDFGAKHILEVVDSLAKKNTFQDLTLTIQPGESVGEGTKANDLKDEEVVDDLKKKFDNRFHRAWIPIGRVNGWVASSYHIKMAVKDNRSMWLSSGNWQSSNQPPLEKLEDISPAFLLRTYNREWHVIIDNEELSQTYEKFIRYDYENNKNYKSDPSEALEGLNFLFPTTALELTEAVAPAYESFKPFAENRDFTVTPLLTPDNYHNKVLELINTAESELLIQNQTFNAPNAGQVQLEQLINAVLQKQREGVAVKIIFRIINSAAARKNLERLIEMGFDKNNIKLQKNCHNKGIIVDKKKIMLGSQNWSNDGVSVNRDASLIFTDEKLAVYFRTIFLHDWNKLARYNIGQESYSIEIANDIQNIPKGMELMTWSEVREVL